MPLHIGYHLDKRSEGLFICGRVFASQNVIHKSYATMLWLRLRLRFHCDVRSVSALLCLIFLLLFCGLVLCPCLLPLPVPLALPLPLPPLALGLFSLHFTRGAAARVACALNRFASKLKHFKIYTHNCQKVLEFVYQRKVDLVPFPYSSRTL